VIASVTTFVYNFFADKRRAGRDYITKSFDAAREDVRRSVESSVDYFALDVKGRKPSIEAKVLMGERDVRLSVSLLIDFCTVGSESRKALQAALDSFVDAVTGGSFQSSKAKADLEQVKKVAGAGAELRAAIVWARKVELHEAIYGDWFSKRVMGAHAYMTDNVGYKHDD